MSTLKNKNLKVTKENFGELLLSSVKEAHNHACGKVALNSSSLKLPSEPPIYNKTKIKMIREKLLGVSQPVFAAILGCTPSSVKSWERGENTPNGPARRLLQIIEKNPSIFLKTLSNSN